MKILIDLIKGNIEIDGNKKETEKTFKDLSDAMENKKFRTIVLNKETVVNKEHIVRIVKNFDASLGGKE